MTYRRRPSALHAARAGAGVEAAEVAVEEREAGGERGDREHREGLEVAPAAQGHEDLEAVGAGGAERRLEEVDDEEDAAGPEDGAEDVDDPENEERDVHRSIVPQRAPERRIAP